MNGTELFDNGEQLRMEDDKGLKKDVLRIVEEGIKKVIPYVATKEAIHYEGDTLKIGTMEFLRQDIEHIYVIGVGKGSYPIAQALDEIFGDEITEGFVIVKEGEKRRLPHIEIFESSHPIPDERSVEGAKRMMAILKKAGSNDLVLAAITGGASALANLPADGISVEDLKTVNHQLLKCGASIGKMNAVRKHLCLIKGGRVVQCGQPATVITFTFDTAPPDMPWPDMCLPDPTTFADAIHVLKTYNLWDKVPVSIRERLTWGMNHPEAETIKSLEGMKQQVISVADPEMACLAAAEEAKRLGYTPYILSTTMEGEAKDVGIVLAGISDEILTKDRPFKKPCALISGGETTVTINGKCGEGGPNQETVLGYITKIRGAKDFAFVSIDTDGTDGPCKIAGGIVDGNSKRKLQDAGIDVNSELREHNSSKVLEAIGGAIMTGHTGTNMMNLRVVVLKNE